MSQQSEKYYQELDQKIAAELKGIRIRFSYAHYAHSEPQEYSATCYQDLLLIFKWNKNTWRIFHKPTGLEVAWAYSNNYQGYLSQQIAKRIVYRLLHSNLDWNFSSNETMTQSVKDHARRIMAEVWNEELPAEQEKSSRPPIATYLQDIDRILQNRKLANREQLDPVTQNKVIERAIVAFDDGIITRTELFNWIDEVFDYNRTETFIKAEEVLEHYRGRKSATARWQHFEQKLTAEQLSTVGAAAHPASQGQATQLTRSADQQLAQKWTRKEQEAIIKGQLAFNW